MTPIEMLERQKRLRSHVASVDGVTCEWGRDDCTAWAAAWVKAERGIATPIPSYSGEEEGRAMMQREGGLLALWSKWLSLNGVGEAFAPAYGDVALIDTSRFGPVGVILVHGGVAAWRASNGVSFIRPRDCHVLKVWAV
jgi:hypothetical protein